jgi:hypothetical protein
MRYVLCAAVALAFAMPPAPAHAIIHVVKALKDKHHAKHDSLFEKLRHHHAMKPKHKLGDHFKHGGGHGGGGCPTCH